ncbi:uncharacterized protein LOC100854112 isoform X1 [Vitis vinifera]|uniref:uncharacterized protein LOC100854112 isoform X1 n=1 Tax=Vitis vinifera TaxID=29760 RepID=UPI00288309D8|nr:uncharacterized protein LOC100854112 isoform X1 [Vitis vinifera]
MSSSSFLQTKHHSSFNMQQMIREEVEGMARPKRFFSSSCRTRLSTPSELTVGNPTCNKCSALVLDINFCGLWGCSTALIPARVAQALKLNFDEMGVVSPSLGGRFSLQHDAAPGRRNSLYPPQKQHWPAPPAMKHQEMDVPRGWTH